MVALSIIPISVISYFIFFHEVVVENPPSIEISVNADEYKIGSNRSKDLISLIASEFETRQIQTEPSIVLSVGSTVKYQRVVDTISILKKYGYENVSLDDQQ